MSRILTPREETIWRDAMNTPADQTLHLAPMEVTELLEELSDIRALYEDIAGVSYDSGLKRMGERTLVEVA